MLISLIFGGLALGTVAVAAPPGPTALTLSASEQQRLGITSSPLVELRARGSRSGLAKVMDIGPWATLEAETDGARAAAEASNAEVARRLRLAAADQSASQQAVETARAQAVADRARLRLAERRLALEWGADIAQRSVAQRAQLLDDIAAGAAVLLRIDATDTHDIPDPNAGTVKIRLAYTDHVTITGKVLGLTPTVEPRLQTSGLFVLVRKPVPGDLRSGRVFMVDLESGPLATGVVLPASALLRLDGATWAYVRTGQTEFMRRVVTDARPVAAGWFVTAGFKPGEEIIVTGVGSALAVERASDAAPEMD